MKNSLHLSLAAALAVLAGPVVAGSGTTVAGQKLDSGLGQLPHYSTWADPSGRGVGAVAGVKLAGESLDDGLGQLPHYSAWLDRSGRDPLGRETLRISVVRK
jgi:hypothetical protein